MRSLAPRPGRLLTRFPALLASSALVLTGCAGADDDLATDDPGTTQGSPTDDTAAPEATAEPTPSPTVAAPEGVAITEPGTQLAFGDVATVAYERGNRSGVLQLTVDSARRGKKRDLVGFDLDNPYKRRGHYYYVRVTVRNAGEKRFGGFPVPLWGVSGEHTLLQPVEFTSSFRACPTEEVPAGLRPGKGFKSCLVYLSPNRGSLEAVAYRPHEQYDPIEWRGPVQGAPRGQSGGAGDEDATGPVPSALSSPS